MVNEQKTFSEIERLSKIALEAGDLVKLQNMLLPLLREDDRSRSVSENLFIYRTLGTIYEEQGQHAESLIAYEQAHGYDARDFETLNTLVDAELKKDVTAQDEHKMLELMIFHREMLKPALVTRIFKAMGDARREKGELSQAREFYEKALDVRPGDMDLINAIIQVSEASGDEDAIKAAREKLLDMMTAPESRAAVLVSIGDDYLNRLKDEQKLSCSTKKPSASAGKALPRSDAFSSSPNAPETGIAPYTHSNRSSNIAMTKTTSANSYSSKLGSSKKNWIIREKLSISSTKFSTFDLPKSKSSKASFRCSKRKKISWLSKQTSNA